CQFSVEFLLRSFFSGLSRSTLRIGYEEHVEDQNRNEAACREPEHVFLPRALFHHIRDSTGFKHFHLPRGKLGSPKWQQPAIRAECAAKHGESPYRSDHATRWVVGKYRTGTHPIREDVKKKFFSLPSREASVATCIQPRLLIRGAFVFLHWIAAYFSGDASPSCLSQRNGCM